LSVMLMRGRLGRLGGGGGGGSAWLSRRWGGTTAEAKFWKKGAGDKGKAGKARLCH
jgi:hypothetical protein